MEIGLRFVQYYLILINHLPPITFASCVLPPVLPSHPTPWSHYLPLSPHSLAPPPSKERNGKVILVPPSSSPVSFGHTSNS
uniref:Uncharacterized protein n=1 Tax=Oryza brachyantha TaxID=4533 RepID=J3LLM0_ORYBR